METIITIDFDIIMWPSIELYNNFINGDIDNMRNITQQMPLLNYANADLELYKKLTNYLLKLKEQNVNFVFINSHEQILNEISNKCNLINIDHHHDLGYGISQWKDKIIACGNWAYWAIQKDLIKSYIWLHDPMSTKISIDENYSISEKASISTNIIMEMKLNEFIIPSKIIICSSYSWIPIHIRPLYELWEQIFKK